MLIGLLLLFLLSVTYGQVPPTDRNCGHDLANLWLDVVVVVDNSAPMTQEGLTEVAAQIVTVFGAGTRIGTNYIDKRTTRVGLVTYNTEATIQADLNRFQSPDDLFSTVFQILPNDLSTSEDVFLAKGIGAAEQLLAAGRKNNTRKNYKQMVIVYASAYNDEGEEDPRPIAERLKASGVSIATVAFDQTGDEEMIKLIGEIATPGFNFTNEDENLVKEIQTAMIQTNCYCSNLWTQYRETFEDPHSSKFGVCLRPVALTAGWTPAKFACQNMIQTGYMVTEYDQKKHDYVFKLVRNDTSFPEPYVYHIGLSYVNGGYAWQQPVGHALVPLNDSLWNPGFPTQSSTTTAVLNQQSSSAFRVGWQNVNQYTVSERYVCEVAACDTSTYCE
ncbi:VWFA domain-containing protein [Caenorhabditis elegans]|uniref:VWFA domain-containing protein n=1 Tax=Caenorhabditis elegans TaxID=6239 RepID=O45440_CAEEL|nr:VWFA domain-containing protein [Caenorhabditis elegans]CAB03054.1 VWFA domain-containing protein [Caenorhabditis elegans]|eukprot:NP_496742.1 C-type LECtin [Caenorhabditis elegans]